MFCCGVKQTVEDNCILAHSILKMLEIPFQKLKFKQVFRGHAPPPRERLLPVKNLSPPRREHYPLCRGIAGTTTVCRYSWVSYNITWGSVYFSY